MEKTNQKGLKRYTNKWWDGVLFLVYLPVVLVETIFSKVWWAKEIKQWQAEADELNRKQQTK